MPAPAPSQARPPTFAQLALRSEVHRIYGMFGIFCAMLLIGIIRSHAAAGQERFHASHYILVSAGLVYGLIPWSILRRCAARGLPIPMWLTVCNIVVEAAIPTGFMYLLFAAGQFSPIRSITAPAILGYALALILSTLRLSPALCIVSGSLCAVGHAAVILAALAAVRANPGRASGAELAGSTSYFFVYPIAIFIAGLAAAYVAAQLRGNVRALLSETNARQRAELEISVAAEIQQGLLPKTPPDFPGFDIAFWNRPADQTGGDYYDWQLLPDGKLALSLADVSGHGLGPALVAAFCRAYARAVFQGDHTLERTVARVNALIADDLPPGRFVTFAVAVLSPNSPDIGLLSAGHGPILIRRAAASTVEERAADRMPLGIASGETLDVRTPLALAEDDALILVTDGFFEWPRADGERFGIERLKHTITSSPRDAAATIAAMRTAVESFTSDNPGPQPDDLSVVIIRRIASAKPARDR